MMMKFKDSLKIFNLKTLSLSAFSLNLAISFLAIIFLNVPGNISKCFNVPDKFKVPTYLRICIAWHWGTSSVSALKALVLLRSKISKSLFTAIESKWRPPEEPRFSEETIDLTSMGSPAERLVTEAMWSTSNRSIRPTGKEKHAYVNTKIYFWTKSR